MHRRPFHAIVNRLTPLIMTMAVSTSASTLAQDRVERRGQAPAIDGTIARIGEDGVEIVTDLGARQVISWDRVYRVQTTRFAAPLESMMPVAESLWRARSRVERGDSLLAEPLLERLFDRYRGQTHETALVVAEGLLRCRLARGDQPLAVLAAIEVARLRRAGVSTDAYRALPPVIDDSTLLCPLLPPLMPDGPTLERLRRARPPTDDPVCSALMALYAAAPVVGRDGVVRDAQPLPPLSASAAADPGVRLLDQIVRAAASPPAIRSATAERMLADPPSTSTFAEPWLRAMHGLALVAEQDPQRVRRGVVQLLHVPALHRRTHPWLAGTALLIAAEAERVHGDPAAAAALRRELLASHSYHPLVDRSVRRPASPTSLPENRP